MTTITERVAKGAAFLDEHDPEWWRADVKRAIDLEKLDVGMGSSCILGQRCPLETEAPFTAQAEALSGLSYYDDGHSIGAWVAAHGFDRSPDSWSSEYGALTAEWRRVIRERRHSASLDAMAQAGSRCTSCGVKRASCRCGGAA